MTYKGRVLEYESHLWFIRRAEHCVLKIMQQTLKVLDSTSKRDSYDAAS